MSSVVVNLRLVRGRIIPRSLDTARQFAITTRRLAQQYVVPFLRRSGVAAVRLVREEVAPKTRAANQWIARATRSLHRDRARLNNRATALAPSQLAVLSSTTLTVAVAAIVSVDLISPRQPPIAPLVPTSRAAPWSIAAATVFPAQPQRIDLDDGTVAAPAPRATTPPPRARRGPAATRDIQNALNQYRDAFSVLDVDQVRGVWPSVDVPGLRKHFGGLRDQNIEFANCQIAVSGSRATALCRGSLSYVSSGQGGRVQTEDRQWQFRLRNSRGRWLITSVAARLPGKISRAVF